MGDRGTTEVKTNRKKAKGREQRSPRCYNQRLGLFCVTNMRRTLKEIEHIYVKMKEFPTITEIASNGKTKVWNISVVEEDGMGKIIVKFGFEDGKQQIQERIIEKGKNIGKSNETTPYTQALQEAESKWKKKKEVSSIILPMLAQDYRKHKKHIKYPSYVQPKLDGVRLTATYMVDRVVFRSRMGKELYNLEHIEEEILKNELMKKGETWDGELYSRNMIFDEISGYCRTNKSETKNTHKPEFWVFDTCDTTLEFSKRMPVFGAYHQLKYVHQVECSECENEEQLYKMLKEYEKDSWEGIMVRNKNGMYKNNYRSYDLQKLKSFEDDEFKIVELVEGKGVDKGTGIFVCITNYEESTTFQVKPEGTREKRKEYFENKEKMIGKLLTVRYQELTKIGVPRFPVGVSIRDYE